MRHLRMVGLALVAVFAMAAVAATSASALPEWGECVAKAGGKFTDSNCTKKATLTNPGSFEWKKGTELKPRHFHGENVGSGGVLISKFRACFKEEGKGQLAGRVTRAKCKEIKGEEVHFEEPILVECEHEENTGEALGAKSIANVFVKFTGCKVFGSTPCSNGPGVGEITVNPLKGELGYINKLEKKVGVLLTPVTAKGEFAKFNCAGQLETVVGVGNKTEGAEYVKGTKYPSGCSGACPGATPEEETHGGYDGIISPVTPVNTMTSTLTQVYTVNPVTVANIPSHFEGKHIELLEDYLYNPSEPAVTEMWSRAGEEITNTNTTAEPGEIKA
jgi:hypothetical protein